MKRPAPVFYKRTAAAPTTAPEPTQPVPVTDVKKPMLEQAITALRKESYLAKQTIAPVEPLCTVTLPVLRVAPDKIKF